MNSVCIGNEACFKILFEALLVNGLFDPFLLITTSDLPENGIFSALFKISAKISTFVIVECLFPWFTSTRFFSFSA